MNYLQAFQALYLKTSIRQLASMLQKDRDTIRKHVYGRGLDPDNLRGIDICELKQEHKLEKRMPELLDLVSEAVRDSDLTPEQQDDVGAGVVVAIAAWATGHVPESASNRTRRPAKV